jgi:hypothetical protein
MLDVYFLGPVTRKGESCLGDDAALDKCLDLWNESQQRQENLSRYGEKIDQLAVLSIFIELSPQRKSSA